jgi:hypothetical protein
MGTVWTPPAAKLRLVFFRPAFLAIGFALLASGTTLQGQERPSKPKQPDAPAGRSFVPLPFDGDLEALLKARLQQAKGREEFERFLKDFQKDPGRFKLDDKALQEKLKDHLDNPLVRQQIEQAERQHKGGLPLGPEQMKGVIDAFKKTEPKPADDKDPDAVPKMNGATPSPIQPPTGPGAAGPGPKKPSPPADSAEGREQLLDEWLRNRMEGLENSRVGRILRDSPAFQQGLFDLEKAILEHRGEGFGLSSWDMSQLGSRLQPPDWALSPLEGGWLKLQGMHWPSLPHPHLSLGGFGGWKLSAPSAGGGGGLGPGRVLLWILLLVAGGLLVWQVLARLKAQAGPGTGRGWRLGPWPVPPDRIASRADLIRAFEHLSLLLLGPAAQTWHHLAVADGLAAGAGPATSQRHNAAVELATLYEQARYAPDEGPLPAEALAAARRDLCLLAGVAHA